MKKILRYIIPVLFATFFLVGNPWESDSLIVENQANALSTEIDDCYLDLPISYFDLAQPCQILGVNNVVRTQNSIKRTRNGHRSNFELEKVGKAINAKIDNLVQNNSFNHYHRFVKSVSWLISLGKLII